MGLLGFTSANEKKCIICEHIGFAETETQAHINLLGIRISASGVAADPGGNLKALFLSEAGPASAGGTDLTPQNNYCLSGLLPLDGQNPPVISTAYTDSGSNAIPHAKPLHVETIGSGTNGFSYCVAQFFVYYAQDMDK